MRTPFVVAIHTNRRLTDMQSRKRAKLLVESRTYREHLNRLRRKAKRRADKRKSLPKKGGLFFGPSPITDPEICLYVQAIETLDAGNGKPHEQLMLEFEVWEKKHRALITAIRAA